MAVFFCSFSGASAKLEELLGLAAVAPPSVGDHSGRQAPENAGLEPLQTRPRRTPQPRTPGPMLS